MSRSARMTLLAQLLSGHRFSSQEELVDAMAEAGVSVTQATLSRDLRSLGVGKRPDAQGRPVYELPAPATETLDRERQLLDLRAFVNEVRVAGNLVVLLTPPGHANGVGRAIDMAEFPGVMGTIAGDDTLLIIMKTSAHGHRLKKRLDALAGRVEAAK